MTDLIALNEKTKMAMMNAKHYVEFLQVYLKKRGRKACVCRKAGFSSRSYLSEVIQGKKGLSRDSFQRIKGALGLSSLWVAYFECLVWKSEVGLRPRGLSEELNRSKLGALRENLMKVKLYRQEIRDSSSALHCIHQPQLFQVYAALGPEGKGAERRVIMQRTRLSSDVVELYLQRLLALNVIDERQGRFYAPVSKSDALSIKNSQVVANLMGQVCKKMYQDRDLIAKNSKNMVVYSALSVSSRQLELIKQRLSAVIFDVLDEFQDDEGDTVQQLFVGFFDNPF